MAKIDDAKMVWDAATARLKLDGKNAVYGGETVRELLLPGILLFSSTKGQLLDIWLHPDGNPGPKVFSAWLKEGGAFDLVNFKRGDWERILHGVH